MIEEHDLPQHAWRWLDDARDLLERSLRHIPESKKLHHEIRRHCSLTDERVAVFLPPLRSPRGRRNGGLRGGIGQHGSER